ncbi:MAG: hypothetical protein K2F78_09910 [Muribaculaceae bacterium]|nr:hypothetical protein [Muribaculaceae bacterium]
MSKLFATFFLSIAILGHLGALAQQPLNDADRDKVFSQMRAYKHRLLVKELELDKEQEKAFFPVYDRMDDQLQQIGAETRDLERRVMDNAEASDTEIEAAAAAVYSQKQREGKVEAEYYDRFKELLTPRQLLRLKSAERKFTQQLVRQHRRMQRESRQ